VHAATTATTTARTLPLKCFHYIVALVVSQLVNVLTDINNNSSSNNKNSSSNNNTNNRTSIDKPEMNFGIKEMDDTNSADDLLLLLLMLMTPAQLMIFTVCSIQLARWCC
jgi:hypothetical protein